MVTRNILITPAEDCPAKAAEIPPAGVKKPTRAALEHACLTGAPYALDHKRFSYRMHVEMADVAGKDALDFDEFHAKGQPCMRASPLTKRYGWAAHYDADGRLALVDPGSQAFAGLAVDKSLPQKPAMRTKRA